MTHALPERADFGQLKKQAKDLLDEIRAGVPAAVKRTAGADPGKFALHDAQRIIAREYGFPSWAKLKLHVETRTTAAAAVRLIEAVCEGAHETVAALLAERPALATGSIAAAAALGNGAALADRIRRDPAAATARSGPRDWEPLLYLCFGRCGAGDAERAAGARVLLDAGANPNTTWIHPTWPESPQAALYGATGVNDHPRLARVLLQAGADPNDCESRYHAAEHFHVAALEVLAEFGADFSGTDKIWGNTPLYFLFGSVRPDATVRSGIRWLLDHGANPNVRSYVQRKAETALHAAVRNAWDPETIALLLNHGADPSLTRADGRTAYALAVALGRADISELLLARGSPATVSPADRLLGACARVDEAEARRLLAIDPDLAARLPATDRWSVIIAAREGHAAAIELMGRLGFDLNITDDEGASPLHWACWHGQADAVRALLRGGANTDIFDRRFDAPPFGWCAHGSRFCRNENGRYGEVAAALIAAGVPVPPGTEASPEVMAAIQRAAESGSRPGRPA